MAAARRRAATARPGGAHAALAAAQPSAIRVMPTRRFISATCIAKQRRFADSGRGLRGGDRAGAGPSEPAQQSRDWRWKVPAIAARRSGLPCRAGGAARPPAGTRQSRASAVPTAPLRRGGAACARTICGGYADADATVWTDRGICAHKPARPGDCADKPGAGARPRARRCADPDEPGLGAWSSAASIEAAQEVARAGDRARTLPALRLLAARLLPGLLGNWTGLPARHEAIRRELEARRAQRINAFAALAMPLSPRCSCARRDAGRASSRPPRRRRARRGRAGAARSLRLGYVSSDFRTHATASLLAEVWERHDRGRSDDARVFDRAARRLAAGAARIEAAFDRFVDCADDSGRADVAAHTCGRY